MQQSQNSILGDARTTTAKRVGFAAPLFVGMAVLLGHVALLYRATISHTDGSFCYPLDDSFIHMAIGRSIADNGVFGVSPHEFAAAASSLLWPMLLGLANLTIGDHLLTPLVLNVLAGCGVVAYVARVLEHEAPGSTAGHRTFWTAAVVVLAPLPTIAIIGMEHTLHILFSCVLLVEAARWLAQDEQRSYRRLAIFGALVTSVRYEGAFLVAVIGGLAILRRRRRAGAVLWGVGAAPIVAFGLYSMAHGGLFLPSSVLVKGNRVHFHDLSDVGDFLGGSFVHRMGIEPHMLAAMIVTALALLVSWRREGRWARSTLRLGIALAVGALHIQFASLNWFFRYEAYLVVMLLLSVGLYALELVPSFVALATKDRWFAATALLASFIGLGALGQRALFAAEQTPSACRNVYDQQVQNARFLTRFFPNEPVALNDIGAVAYYRRAPIIDLVGLASVPIARAKKLDFYTPLSPEDIARFAAPADIAILYDDWFSNNLPKTWIRAGRWRLDWCRSCGSPVVSIYATRPEALERIVRALREFEPSLPEDVVEEGRFVARPSLMSGPTIADGDAVRIDARFTTPKLRRRYSFATFVGTDGRLPYPFQPIPARGLTVDQIADRVRASLEKNKSKDHDLLEPTPPVAVALVKRAALHYFVAGNVFSPGDYWADKPTSAHGAVEMTGGPDSTSDGATPFILRERMDSSGTFDRLEFHTEADSPQLMPLDVVYVP